MQVMEGALYLAEEEAAEDERAAATSCERRPGCACRSVTVGPDLCIWVPHPCQSGGPAAPETRR